MQWILGVALYKWRRHRVGRTEGNRKKKTPLGCPTVFCILPNIKDSAGRQHILPDRLTTYADWSSRIVCPEPWPCQEPANRTRGRLPSQCGHSSMGRGQAHVLPHTPSPSCAWHRVGTQVSPWNRQSFYLLSSSSRSAISKTLTPKDASDRSFTLSWHQLTAMLHLKPFWKLARFYLTEHHGTDPRNKALAVPCASLARFLLSRRSAEDEAIIWRVQVKCQLFFLNLLSSLNLVPFPRKHFPDWFCYIFSVPSLVSERRLGLLVLNTSLWDVRTSCHLLEEYFTMKNGL